MKKAILTSIMVLMSTMTYALVVTLPATDWDGIIQDNNYNHTGNSIYIGGNWRGRYDDFIKFNLETIPDTAVINSIVFSATNGANLWGTPSAEIRYVPNDSFSRNTSDVYPGYDILLSPKQYMPGYSTYAWNLDLNASSGNWLNTSLESDTLSLCMLSSPGPRPYSGGWWSWPANYWDSTYIQGPSSTLTIDYDEASVNPVPEPATITLIICGILGFFRLRRNY
jgi:hypothetical protein